MKFAVAVITLLLGASLVGQSPLLPSTAPSLPTLTDIQKLTVQNAVLLLEVARLRAENAIKEFETARTAMATVTKDLEVEGYELNLQTLSYSPRPSPQR